ncbi:uncharacterized protein LOC122057765 [Macadamia integrifolia]|uniref:uncharacterized protein LOC122057765 n=1 Tax=Macadamia integrifolia TaxID=60698 RepID=UPI001C53070D|nr:uncharacterized protein LOC122057765 [Macadamia integrifolia]
MASTVPHLRPQAISSRATLQRPKKVAVDRHWLCGGCGFMVSPKAAGLVQTGGKGMGLMGGLSKEKQRGSSHSTVVCAVGDVSADGNTYLIAGAVAVALLGTAFPLLFSRKDLCPECDGAGFVRKSGVTLRANAARKDQIQIVCARCNGLGKLGQIDKYSGQLTRTSTNSRGD